MQYTSPIVLAAATRREMQAILSPVGKMPKLSYGYPYDWPFAGRNYLLLITGIGPINAALSLGRTLGLYQQLTGVLNLGIAGSFQLEKLPLLSTVVVKEEIWPEYGLRTFNDVDPKGLKYALGRIHSGFVWDRLMLYPQQASKNMGFCLPSHWQEGRSLSVAGATGTRELADFFLGKYEVELENMEGFALAWACVQSNIPFLEIRIISNLVGSRLDDHWKINEALDNLGKIFTALYATSDRTGLQGL